MSKNCEEVIKHLMHEKRIKTQKDLLREMYKKINNREFKSPVPECEEWVKKNESNFSSMKKGERGFPLEFKYALSEISGKSFSEILNGKKEKKEDYTPFGIRYAAYIDEEWCYQELADIKEVDAYRPVLLNYDEYGKTIIDYVIEKKAEKGLRFLIDNEFLKSNHFLKFEGVYRADEFSDELWDWIFSIDDAEIFLKAFGEQNLFDFFSFDEAYQDGEKEKFLKKIVGTNRIIEALCNERIYPHNEFKYMPSILFEVLKFALETNKQAIAQRIIEIYTKFIDSQTTAFQNATNQESSKSFKVIPLNSAQSEIYYDGSLIMYVWDFSELNGKSNGFEGQIEFCQTTNILNRLVVKNLSAMEYGDSFVKDGIYYIKKKPDISLEALIYLTKEKDCKFLPTYIGEESGVTKIRAYNSGYNASFKELGEMLGEIHSLSQEKLGEDRVYMYSRGFAGNYCFGHTMSKKTTIIGSWQICDIGTPIFDIISAFLNYCNRVYSYFREPYGCFIEEKNRLYEELSGFLNAYPDKRVIENFGDKLNEELDRRLKDAIQGKKVIDIERIYMIKSFAEIYRENLNSVTRCTSNI